ncbi:hypothetical protein AYI70_g7961 [Smittium culicis]|uniref:Uncharacterized protein n=1 Tax=Smittium culicis TaxID=133412 RepID=A0A1R1XI74_9FUNG|nr:hypothetical protein AYI70_g7961 [Smittium culicis]
MEIIETKENFYPSPLRRSSGSVPTGHWFKGADAVQKFRCFQLEIWTGGASAELAIRLFRLPPKEFPD